MARINYGCGLTAGCTGHDGHPGECSEKVSDTHKIPERFGKPVTEETDEREKETPRDTHKRGR